MRDDESSGSDYASESEEEIDEREFTCENVRVRARARERREIERGKRARGRVVRIVAAWGVSRRGRMHERGDA